MTPAVLPLMQAAPGSVPRVSDTVAIVVGTVLTVLVIYAIVAANLRQRRRGR